MALLSNINFYFDCKTILCLMVPGRHGKIFFTQEINEQDISLLNCKHKHMMKSGTPPDKKSLVLYVIEFHGFLSRIDF